MADMIFSNESLKITSTDNSRRYFGDFHVVSLELRCEMDILPRHFDNQAVFDEVVSLLGDKLIFFRTVQQMGVPSAEVHLVKKALIDNFKSNSLPYVMSPTFTSKAVFSKIRKSGKQRNTGNKVTRH